MISFPGIKNLSGLSNDFKREWQVGNVSPVIAFNYCPGENITKNE